MSVQAGKERSSCQVCKEVEAWKSAETAVEEERTSPVPAAPEPLSSACFRVTPSLVSL